MQAANLTINEFDNKTGKKSTDCCFFLPFFLQNSCNDMTKRIPLTSGEQKKKWQLKQQFWRSIFRKIRGKDLHIYLLLQHPKLHSSLSRLPEDRGGMCRMEQKKMKALRFVLFSRGDSTPAVTEKHAPSWTNKHHLRAFSFQAAKNNISENQNHHQLPKRSI